MSCNLEVMVLSLENGDKKWSNLYKIVKSQNGYKIAIFHCFSAKNGHNMCFWVKKQKILQKCKKSIFGEISMIFRFSPLILKGELNLFAFFHMLLSLT